MSFSERCSALTPTCNQGSWRYFQGLYFTESSQEALPIDVVTIFPPIENALSKRFPLFENILGTMQPIHECIVRVQHYHFLVAYQARPHSLPNQALSSLVPNVEVRGEILVIRSGKTVLVQSMGGRSAAEAAKIAVRE